MNITVLEALKNGFGHKTYRLFCHLNAITFLQVIPTRTTRSFTEWIIGIHQNICPFINASKLVGGKSIKPVIFDTKFMGYLPQGIIVIFLFPKYIRRTVIASYCV